MMFMAFPRYTAVYRFAMFRSGLAPEAPPESAVFSGNAPKTGVSGHEFCIIKTLDSCRKM